MVSSLGLIIDIRNCLRLLSDKARSMRREHKAEPDIEIGLGQMLNLIELAEHKARQLYDDEYDNQERIEDDGR